MFPPVNSGGLIEAFGYLDGPRVDQGCAFPPVNSGGLIEASDIASVPVTVTTARVFRR